jgi:hypothetical protein
MFPTAISLAGFGLVFVRLSSLLPCFTLTSSLFIALSFPCGKQSVDLSHYREQFVRVLFNCGELAQLVPTLFSVVIHLSNPHAPRNCTLAHIFVSIMGQSLAGHAWELH